MAKKQKSLISEDKHSFLVHDGDKHFPIAKRSISEDMHDMIRKLPKYADGGVVEDGQIPDARMDSASKLGVSPADLNGIDQYPIPDAQRSPASFDGQSHPILGMLPNFMFENNVNPYSTAAPQTVPSPAPQQPAPDTTNPALTKGPSPASIPNAPAKPAAQAPGAAALPQQPDVLGGFQGAGKQYVKGLQEEQKAQSELGKQEADVYKNMFPPEFENDLKNRFGELQKERMAAKADLDKTREAAFQGKEDPNRYWNNLSTGNKVMASIALILGGAGSGGNANNNAALNTLNSAIDRDVQAQRNDKANAQNLYRANLERYKDADTAMQMTTLQLKTVAEGKLMAAAAAARDPLAKAKLDQAAGMFGRQNVIEGEQIYQQQLQRKVLQSLNNSNANPEQVLNALRVYDPKRAEEMQKRYVPGIGFGQVEVPDKVRDEIAGRHELAAGLEKLQRFAKAHQGTTMDRDTVEYGKTIAKQVQDAYRRANGQGVFREAEAGFVNNIIAEDPSAFFANQRTLPKYKAAIEMNKAALNSKLGVYGLPAPRDIASVEGPPNIK